MGGNNQYKAANERGSDLHRELGKEIGGHVGEAVGRHIGVPVVGGILGGMLGRAAGGTRLGGRLGEGVSKIMAEGARVQHEKANANLPINPEYQKAGITKRDVNNPVEYTSPTVLAHPAWADPETPPGGVRPENPWGKTGITGRGLLGKWGANNAEDAIVTRVNRGRLEVATIRRKDTGQVALPGGMVDKGERGGQAVAREFNEEAGNKLDFSGAKSVYNGYVQDPRNTDNAWMVTDAYHLHLSGKSGGGVRLKGGDDATSAKWTVVNRGLLRSMYANHSTLLQNAVDDWQKESGMTVGSNGRVRKR